jgi:hypothetical protein
MAQDSHGCIYWIIRADSGDCLDTFRLMYRSIYTSTSLLLTIKESKINNTNWLDRLIS